MWTEEETKEIFSGASRNFYKTLVVNGLVEEIDQIDRVLVHAVQKNIRGVQNDAHGDVRVKLMEFL